MKNFDKTRIRKANRIFLIGMLVAVCLMVGGINGLATAETINWSDEHPVKENPNFDVVDVGYDSGDIQIKINATSAGNDDLLSNNLSEVYIDTGVSEGLDNSTRPTPIYDSLNISADYRVSIGNNKNNIAEWGGSMFNVVEAIDIENRDNETIIVNFSEEAINSPDTIDFQAIFIEDFTTPTYAWTDDTGTLSLDSYYNFTVNVTHNTSDVDTSYEILDDTDNVVASGNTGSDGTVTENLESGTYDVELAYSDGQYSNVTTTVTLDSSKTLSETLSKNTYDLTVNATQNGSSVDTDYEIEDSSDTVVANGSTSSGTVTETLDYGTYDVNIAYNDTSYNNTTKTATVDSDKTVDVLLDEAYYTVSIKAENSTSGINTTYAVVDTSNNEVSGRTNNSSFVDLSLSAGNYDIEIAHNDSEYDNITDTISLDQNISKTYSISDSGGGGLIGGSGVGTGLIGVVVATIVAILLMSGSSSSGRGNRRNR